MNSHLIFYAKRKHSTKIDLFLCYMHTQSRSFKCLLESVEFRVWYLCLHKIFYPMYFFCITFIWSKRKRIQFPLLISYLWLEWLMILKIVFAEMMRQAGVGSKTSSPKDRALNRQRERTRFASPGKWMVISIVRS